MTKLGRKEFAKHKLNKATRGKGLGFRPAKARRKK